MRQVSTDLFLWESRGQEALRCPSVYSRFFDLLRCERSCAGLMIIPAAIAVLASLTMASLSWDIAMVCGAMFYLP